MPESLFKISCNFKRRLRHRCFPLNSENIEKHLFRKTFFQKLLRKYTTKSTTRMLVQLLKNTCKEIRFSIVSGLETLTLTFLGTIVQQLFSLNIQNSFPWLLPIIHRCFAIFISSSI